MDNRTDNAALAEADRKDDIQRSQDRIAVDENRMTAAEAVAREEARRRYRAACLSNQQGPAARVLAEPVPGVKGNFEQPATIGVFNAAGRPVRAIAIPAVPEDWVPGAEIVVRDGSTALSMPVLPGDKAGDIADKLDQLRLAVWHVRHGVVLPGTPEPVAGTNCPTCGAPEWARDDRAKAMAA